MGQAKDSSCDSRQSWRQADTATKQRRLDAQREQDARRISQRAEAGKTRRDERLDGLMAGLAGDHGVIAEVGQELRANEAMEAQRRRTQHSDWEASVFQPVQALLMQHHASPGRCGRSSGPARDPIKRELVERAEEEAFDREVTHFLAATAPASWRAAASPAAGLAKARSRSTLDATSWGQLQVQALPQCCSLAQTTGPGICTWKRLGGAPDESDGVPSAGKRTVRTGARSVVHGDLGQLRSDRILHLGEAAEHHTRIGASSGAPAQDHYTFRTDGAAADLEFPRGKRQLPRWP